MTCPAIVTCERDNLIFTPVIENAAFPPRHSGGVELLKKSMRIGTTTFPINSMVVYGGTGQGNELLTDTWISSNGVQWVQVPSTQTFTGSAWSGHIVDSKSQIYKIGGERWGTPNTVNNDVWMSTNAGVTWNKQPGTNLPPRAFPDVYVDSSDVIYVVGGLNGDGLSDIWASSDSGRTWRSSGSLPVPSPPGRSSATLLIHKSPVLNKDIMTYFGGYSRGGSYGVTYHNE